MTQPVPGAVDERRHQEVPVEKRSLVGRAWGQPLWAHAGLLLLVLLALLPLMSPDSSFSSDEGAYALQVEALEHGSWAYDYEAGPHDPEGRHFPVYLSTRSESGFFPYVKHPTYPLLLQAARRLAGPTLGLHLLALVGTVGTAAAAWLLAAEVSPRLSRPAFWLAAASPVLVNGFLLWAHAPSAALAGLALVGAARIARRDFTVPVALAVAAVLAAGVLLRSEALLFAAALVVALACTGWRGRTGTGRLAPLVLAAPAVIVALAEHAWIGRIIGQPFTVAAVRPGALSYLEGRFAGALHELSHPPAQDPEAAMPVLLALVLVAGLGRVALRRFTPADRRDVALLTLLAAGAVVLLAVRLALRPYEPVTGLFAAWPLGLLGLLLLRWRGAGPTVALLAGTVALFTGAVLLTQYPEGGATEWGGRFLSPAVAPLAVLAAAGLAGAVDVLPRPHRRSVAALLATVAVTFAVFGLATVGLQRARIARVAQAVARHPAEVTVTTGAFLPRAAWSIDHRVRWMHAERAELAALVRHLRERGLQQVAVVLPADVHPSPLSAFPTVEEQPEPALKAVGLRLFVGKA